MRRALRPLAGAIAVALAAAAAAQPTDRCDNCGLPKWSMRDPDSDAPPTCG